MSLSNKTGGSINPINRYFSWGGKEGQIKAWNKEEKQNDFFDLPFKFIVLDQLNSISGYSSAKESGIFSNLFRKTTDKIVVQYQKTKEKIVEGCYSEEDVKDKIKAKGGKYAQDIFFMDAEREISTLKLTGAAMSAWFEFKKKVDLEETPLVKITGKKKEKNAAGIEYFVPIFECIPTIKEQTLNQAVELDTKLQKWLSGKVEAKEVAPTIATNSEPVEEMPEAEPAMAGEQESDDLPF